MADSRKLRICFITGTLGRGGAERQLIYMLRALQNAGAQTRVLCLTKGEPLEEEIRAMGIRVTWVGRSRWRPIRLIRILRELLAERADIVQSSHFYTNLYAAVAGKLLAIRSIGAIRNDVTSEIESNGKIGWAQLHLPAHLIANSQLGRSKAIAKGIDPERIDMLSNVVMPGDHSRITKSKDQDAIRILFAARLTQQKRPDRFLHTLRNITSARPDLKFTASIAGDGPLRSELHGLASQLGLTERHVEFLGELKDVRPFYYKSDFLMLTSDWEGTPNVLLEAMACGLPVVATKVGGVPEIVAADRGLVVEAGDDDGLTAATIRMIENGKLRSALGNHGLEYVSRHHSLAALEDQLINVYTKLVS